jgi:hypothetical protein
VPVERQKRPGLSSLANRSPLRVVSVRAATDDPLVRVDPNDVAPSGRIPRRVRGNHWSKRGRPGADAFVEAELARGSEYALPSWTVSQRVQSRWRRPNSRITSSVVIDPSSPSAYQSYFVSLWDLETLAFQATTSSTSGPAGPTALAEVLGERGKSWRCRGHRFFSEPTSVGLSS